MSVNGSRPALDLAALAATPLRSAPYRWAHLRQALTPEAAARLCDTFPTSGFWRLQQHDGEKFMQFRIRPLVPLGAESPVLPATLPSAWRAFVDELLDPAYRDVLGRALGIPLDHAPLEVSAWRWPADAQLGPHVDIPRKLASQVFYFNEEWDPAWGGCLRILRSGEESEVAAELPPALGSASVVVRSDASWHSVAPVRPGAPERLSVVATWQHPGTESPFWTVERDGEVRCHAAGSTPEQS